VGIEYSAGFTAALAGAAQSQTGWGRCLQAHGRLLTAPLPWYARPGGARARKGRRAHAPGGLRVMRREADAHGGPAGQLSAGFERAGQVQPPQQRHAAAHLGARVGQRGDAVCKELLQEVVCLLRG